MSHSLIISGGTVVDGTGAESKKADVAVDDGRITSIGDLSQETADQTIDATGKLVTPGFVDLHTHLDAQIGWDPEMKPSSYHGVTTALIGNCGVTFAPCGSENRRYLAELMEAVEDIAANAIMDGLPWNWTSFGEYLDTVQTLNPALNVVGMCGHSAIRFEAMGDKSCDEGVQATEEELDRIVELVKESVEGGAVGFSTSRFLGHRVPDGRLTPGTWADARETSAIQRAVVEAGGRGGLFQVAPDMQSRSKIEREMFETGAELGCQVLFSGGTGPQGDGGVSYWQEFLGRNNEAGRRITSICHTRPSGSFFGLAQQAFLRTEGWRELMKLPTIKDRVDALKDPATRKKLVDEAKEAGGFGRVASILHPMGTDEYPDFDLNNERNLQKIADDLGQDPVDVYVDRLIASEGKEFWNLWAFGGALQNQWNYMRLPHVVPMLGDAGAHVGQFTDADSPTFLLGELTRDRNVYSLPEAVYRITGKSAEVLGLKKRGNLKEGWHADINVIDYENLKSCHPEYVRDFPHNGGRIVTKSEGYDATIVAGQVVIQDGQYTGNRPGEVIRDFIRN
ncbi:MAG: amidohydrolase family protein [Gammaproteobacteria bacterium]|nr:amidohydrolase family protein [Gammaproteobacteria bacterium]MYD81602.1 amidohydrolase family protein [Gammaproteobacteria bacterium]